MGKKIEYMKKIITALLVAASLTAIAQSASPNYEKKLATYIYLDIDHDDRWDCIDTSKSAKPITAFTYTENLMCHAYDVSEFNINDHYRSVLSDEVLYSIYKKIAGAYYKSYKTEAKRGEIKHSGVKMTIKSIVEEVLENDEVTVCTNITFTLILQK